MTDADIYREGFDTDGALDAAAPKASAKAAVESAKSAAASLKDAASAAVADARDRVRGVTDEAVDTVQSRYSDLEAWVHQNPARALGVAAGVGVVLGLLLRGRTTRVIYRGRA